MVHIPLICEHTGLSKSALWVLSSVLHGTPFGCMVYCITADPGQIRERKGDLQTLDVEKAQKLPERSHKSWQYPHPIKRYDHYCKWLDNTIALLNHREFVLMLLFLTLVGVLGIILDVYVSMLIVESDVLFGKEVQVILHNGLLFSVAGR